MRRLQIHVAARVIFANHWNTINISCLIRGPSECLKPQRCRTSFKGPPNGLRRLQVILWMLDNNSHSLAPFLLAGSFFILMKILISIPFASSFSATDVMLMSVCQSNDCSSFGGCLGGSAPSMKKRETFPDYIRLPIDSWRFPSKIYEFSPPPRSRGGK